MEDDTAEAIIEAINNARDAFVNVMNHIPEVLAAISGLQARLDELKKQLATLQEDTALEIHCEIHIKPKHP